MACLYMTMSITIHNHSSPCALKVRKFQATEIIISRQEPLEMLFQHILCISAAMLIMAASVNTSRAQEVCCLLTTKKKKLFNSKCLQCLLCT